MIDYCSNCEYNPKILDKLKNEAPSNEMTAALADVFKMFGDKTRIRIIWALFDKEICVYDIAAELGMTQSAISHQLKILKESRIVKSRRDGKNTFYSLHDEHIKRIVEQVIIHITEQLELG